MATGSHVGSNAEVHRLKQAQPHDLLKLMVCSGDEKNMREVSKRNCFKNCFKIDKLFVVYVLGGINRGFSVYKYNFQYFNAVIHDFCPDCVNFKCRVVYSRL